MGRPSRLLARRSGGFRARTFGILIVPLLGLVLILPGGSYMARASAPAGWVGVQPIQAGLSHSLGDPGGATLAVDASGNAIAAWGQHNWELGGPPVHPCVWASWHPAGSGWEAAVPLEPTPGTCGDPEVAVDGLGDAMVVWGSSPEGFDASTSASIRASRLAPGSGWANAVTIWAGPDQTGIPQIAMDHGGNATVVWTFWNATELMSNVWSSRYAPGVGWGAPVRFDVAGSIDSVDVAADPLGNAMAVWGVRNGTAAGIGASRLANGSWGTPVQLANGTGFWYPKLAMDAAGRAIAMWYRVEYLDGYPYPDRIESSRFVPQTGWTSVEVVDQTPVGVGSVSNPAISMNLAGDAVGVWVRSSGLCCGGSVVASRYASGAGWNAPVEVGAFDSGGTFPQPTIDPQGNALIAWSGTIWKDLHNIWASRYTVGVGWGPEEALDLGNGRYGFPLVGMDGRGNAIVAWVQYREREPIGDVWAAAYQVGLGWQPATRIALGSAEDLAPQVASLGKGGTIAVWPQGDPAAASIRSSVLLPGGAWGSAVPVGQGSGVASAPRIGADAQGDVIAVWEEWNGLRNEISSSHYGSPGAWSSPLEIDNGTGNAYSPQIAVNPQGDAFVVWQQSDQANLSIWADRYVAGSGWETPTQIEREEGAALDPQLGVDYLGNAIVTWTLRSGGLGAIWANRYAVGTGWGSARAISMPATSIYDPQIALDARGNATAVWSEATPTGHPGIWANRFEPASGWTGQEEVSASWNMSQAPFSGFSPQIAMNAHGDVALVWIHDTGTGIYQVWAAQSPIGSAPGTWETPTQLTLGNASVLGLPQIAMDMDGNAVAVWPQWIGRDWTNQSVWASRYVPAVGWEAAVPLSFEAAGTGQPCVAMDAGGNATVVWTQWNETVRGVWSNQFDRVNIPPDLFIRTPGATLTNDPVVTVSGSTAVGALVTIDGVSAPTDDHGGFSRTVTLPDGPHTFVIRARDLEGDTNTKDVTITVDTRPPALVLASPPQGAISSEPFVDVSGTTEPGAQLVVNGASIAVAANGSFSLRLVLAEGENRIVASATDPAGNTATASSTVTYVNRLVQELALVRGVAIATSVAVVVLALLLVALHRRRASGEQERTRELEDGLRRESSSGPSSKGLAVPSQPNGGALLNGMNGVAAEKRWPSKEVSGSVRLTAKERILLHLLHFARRGDPPEVPPELTQGRIVEATGIDRRHFAQYVHPLVREGLVRERMAHVRGSAQRRRVYVLTEEGMTLAAGIRARVRSAVVRVQNGSGVREVTVAEVLLEARGSMSVLDVVRESIETGVVDLTR